MKTFIILLMTGMLHIATHAQNDTRLYTSSTIADSMKANANAVVRMEEGNVEIRSASSFIFSNHHIITLLNSNAADHLQVYFSVSKFRKLSEVTLRIYNDAGAEIKKYSKKDFISHAAVDDVTLLSDDKVLYLEAFTPAYPCTVELTSEERISSFVELPDWFIGSPDESVERSAFTVTAPLEADIRYSVKNMVIKTLVSQLGNLKTYQWEAKNIKAKKKELNGYELGYSWPKIEIVPSAFEYDGYKGTFTDWKSFGAWNYDLYEEAAPFSDMRKKDILQLIKDKTTDREKVTVLYDHLKASMRYVSIQLGIGGFKPFAVKFVDDKKYGDCKALTNYMRYLLKTADIKAYPALINAGYNKRPASIDFPEDIFNHVILCVPMPNDTMWLECTSKLNEAGVLGSFTENKKALLLTENGGVLISTPKSNSENNMLTVKTISTLLESGGAEVRTTVGCKGEFVDLAMQLQQRDNDGKKKLMTGYFNFKNSDALQISNFKNIGYTNSFEATASYTQLFDFNAGSKYFFQPKITKLDQSLLGRTSIRTQPYIFKNAYQRTDTSVIMLGNYFDVETSLPDMNIKSKLVDYSYTTSVDKIEKKVTVITTFNLKQNIIPVESYVEVSDILSQINKRENDKLVLKKL